MRQQDETIEIDLWKLILACARRWWMILLVTMVGGVLTFGMTKALVTPTYESTIKIYVNNSNMNVGNLSITASDMTASSKLVDVYEAILNTKDTLDTVIEQAGLEYSYKQVMQMLSTSAVNDTQVFRVTVTSTSPEEAQLIASTIGEVLPDVIGQVIESADARIVERAVLPTQRSGPSYARNAVLGAFLGFLMTILVIALRELMDITIKDEGDLREVTDLPILTYIPDFEEDGKRSYGYKKKYGYGYGYGKRGENG